jgi:hypothetical protein
MTSACRNWYSLEYVYGLTGRLAASHLPIGVVIAVSTPSFNEARHPSSAYEVYRLLFVEPYVTVACSMGPRSREFIVYQTFAWKSIGSNERNAAVRLHGMLPSMAHYTARSRRRLLLQGNT